MGNSEKTGKRKIARKLSDIPSDILILKVEFSDEPYLRKLAEELRRRGVITGFSIITKRNRYEWNGRRKTDTTHVLQTAIPNNMCYAIKQAYDHFRNSIGEEWETPFIHIDEETLVNSDFAEWIKYVFQTSRMKLAVEGIYVPRWSYTPNSPYINLWDIGMKAFDHDEFVEVWENDPTMYKHKAVIVATRNQEDGRLIPQRTQVYVLDNSTSREEVFDAIHYGDGIRYRDWRRLEEGIDFLKFEFPYKDLRISDTLVYELE